MKPSKILLAASAGTTAMTLYSYALSELKSENFKEPQLLAQLFSTIDRPLNRTQANTTGWAIHYLVGLVFTLVYARLIKKSSDNAFVKPGIVMGAIKGVVAIIGWQITLKLHPSPPRVAYKKFYGQLFIAHVIFGVVTRLFLKKYPKALS